MGELMDRQVKVRPASSATVVHLEPFPVRGISCAEQMPWPCAEPIDHWPSAASSGGSLLVFSPSWQSLCQPLSD